MLRNFIKIRESIFERIILKRVRLDRVYTSAGD